MITPLQRIAVPHTLFFAVLLILCASAMMLSIGIGSVFIPPLATISILLNQIGISIGADATIQQESILLIVRLPRVLLSALVGAGLAVAGALLQGVFRNPLVDPGLIGINSGAALSAVAVLALGFAPLGIFTLPVASFCGGVLTTLLVYRLSWRRGHTDVITMLLVGLALNAVLGGVTGVLTFTSGGGNPEMGSLSFWTMGSLGGALWPTVIGVAPFILAGLLLAPTLGRPLNLFALGEHEARHLGVSTERITRTAVILAALVAGASVAAAGAIGFIGLIVPHLARLVLGSDHRRVLPASVLGGATLLIVTDMLARTIAAPLEMPVGLVTACIGGPFFLALILRTRLPAH
jgi:iron complex transport system permease protein